MKIANKTKTNNKIKELAKNIKTIKKENIISIDESSFDTHINSHYGWSKKGTAIKVKKVKQRIRFSIISAISIKKVINTKIIKGSINEETFTDFIKEVVNKVESNKVLFMDNARIHHAKILYNVPYCSELNLIEMVFQK